VTASVILCHPDDAAALWLDEMLRDLGVRSFEVVTVEQVVFRRRIVHAWRMPAKQQYCS
jgi:hypothetical protein